jgi:hypothetical protein
MDVLTAKQIGQINGISTKTKQIGLGTRLQEIIDVINAGIGPTGDKGPDGDKGLDGDKGATGDSGVCSIIPTGAPVNAISATKTLTIDGVVIDGETVTIDNPEADGIDVYEFAADVALTVGEGNIPVNINAYTVKATDGLTVDVKPTVGDIMTIGIKDFTFVPSGTANGDGEIDIGIPADLLADIQASIVKAIRGTDGHNEPHPLVTCGEAFLGNVLAITALIGGVAGNDIATTETFTAETNVFSADKLANGSDCVQANAVTALAAAITDHDTQGVGGVGGAGDTVVLTADIGGDITNTIIIGETMANGEFAGGAVLLSGGVDGTVGEANTVLMDASYLYVTIAENTIAGKNWRRIDLGSVY